MLPCGSAGVRTKMRCGESLPVEPHSTKSGGQGSKNPMNITELKLQLEKIKGVRVDLCDGVLQCQIDHDADLNVEDVIANIGENNEFDFVGPNSGRRICRLVPRHRP